MPFTKSAPFMSFKRLTIQCDVPRELLSHDNLGKPWKTVRRDNEASRFTLIEKKIDMQKIACLYHDMIVNKRCASILVISAF